MTRVLLIPAAGRGSRLNSTTPKVLFPVNGRPMLDYLITLHAPWVDRIVLVVHPGFAADVAAYCKRYTIPIDIALQETPTGMLDAILIPSEQLRGLAPSEVWVTWCDQIAIEPPTLAVLAGQFAIHSDAALAFPTLLRTQPYIHFVRDQEGEIEAILHRREGDVMPDVGESDLGLFGLSAHAYFDLLPEFARTVATGKATQERNFLPFIAWLRGRAPVYTFAGTSDIESVGVNDAADLALIESHFQAQRV